MTTDAKQIEPALSAEEWRGESDTNAAAKVWRDSFPELIAPRRGERFVRLTAVDDDYAEVGPREAPVIIALCNAALPDDSPYKITRADVDRLHDIAVGLDSATDIPGAMGSGRTLLALAAKLAALLPPE